MLSVHSVCNGLHLLIRKSQSRPLPWATRSLSSMSVILCVSYRRVRLCYILHFTYERCRDTFSGLLHSMGQSLCPSVLLQVALFYPLLWQSDSLKLSVCTNPLFGHSWTPLLR